MKKYTFRRTHTYDYEIVAADEPTARKALQKIWAANYVSMTLSDYKLIGSARYQPVKPVVDTEPEPELEPATKPVNKKPSNKKPANKKPAKKIAAKRAPKK